MEPLNAIENIGKVRPLGEDSPGKARGVGGGFAETLERAIVAVDTLQNESEAAQRAYARNEDVDLHEVLIKVEEAEVAFKTMMEIRNKLVEAYREVMRMGA